MVSTTSPDGIDEHPARDHTSQPVTSLSLLGAALHGAEPTRRKQGDARPRTCPAVLALHRPAPPSHPRPTLAVFPFLTTQSALSSIPRWPVSPPPSPLLRAHPPSHIRRLHLPNPPARPKPSPDPHCHPTWYALSPLVGPPPSPLARSANQHPLLIPAHKLCPSSSPSPLLFLIPSQNTENYLLTPSPQGDLCVAKLFPPRQNPSKSSASDPGHSTSSAARVVRCEASRNLKWSITNTGVISPIYKLALPSPDSPDLPLFQVSKPNPNAAFWSMFYFAYAGHNIPPKRIEFGKIQKNPPGPNGGGTRISITGKTSEEKAVWQTLGEGNEDCVEWVVLCAALNLLE